MARTRTKRTTSSMRERLSWRRLLIQVRISFLPTKYALSIIPILDAISFRRTVNTNNSNNPNEKKKQKRTSTLQDKGIKILRVEIWGWGYTFKSKILFLFSEEEKTGKTEENELNERTVKNWFDSSALQREQKPKQDSGHNQSVPTHKEREKEVLYHILFFLSDTYNVCCSSHSWSGKPVFKNIN